MADEESAAVATQGPAEHASIEELKQETEELEKVEEELKSELGPGETAPAS